MGTTTSVVQHGLSAAADPARLPFRYAAPLYDVLTVGPQHVDLAIEQRLRQAAGMPSDLDVLDDHEPLLRDDVVLLTQCELTRLLAALWWIDAMSQRGVDVRGARLAIAPHHGPAPAVVRAVRDARPIGDDLEPLRALRRAITEDRDELSWPVDDVSEPRRPWASVIERIRDLLPDARGLDVLDARLLEQAGTEWTDVPSVIGRAVCGHDDAHRMGDSFAWDRLRELAEDRPAKHPRDVRDAHDRTALVELELRGSIAMRFARVRRTPLGSRALAGRDALEIRAFDRWLGGRFLTGDRILRHGLRRS